ncbi:PA14 domain-containing protein, partial [Rhodopirellula sallentina]
MNYVKRPRLNRDSRRRNRLRIEILEDRRLLTATATSDSNRFDVNQDGYVTAVDALQVINYLSAETQTATQSPTTQKQSSSPFAFDVNQDGNVSPVDALQIINLLNEASGPETASALQSEPSPSASVTLPSQTRTRDIVELSIDSFSELDLASIDRVEIDWGDDRVTSVPAVGLALPLTRLHSYFVPSGTRDVNIHAVTNDGSTVSLASLPIEIVANSPSIVDRVNEGLTAEIFDNTDFSSAPVQIRNDATIDFDFGIEGPSPSLGLTALPFSIRWQGTFTPQETASHNLFANVGANDSAAVYVDNQLLFTAAGNEQSASISLTAGQSVELRIEYVAGSGQSHIRVGSETDSSFKTALPSHQLRPTISAEQLRSGALIETFEAPTLITSIEELRSSESFIANTPASANDLADLTYSQPAGTHATRTRSIVSVPASGAYTFHLAASDTAEVYLSQGVTSDTSRVIVSVDNEAPTGGFQFAKRERFDADLPRRRSRLLPRNVARSRQRIHGQPPGCR